MSGESAIWGGILGSVGSLFNGVGAVESKAKQNLAGSELKYRGSLLNSWASPAGNALQEGLKPGGWLRQAQYDQAAGEVSNSYNKDRQALGSDAWKYGGSSSPLTGRRWYDIGNKAKASYANAQNEIDAKSNSLLSDMMVAQRLGKWTGDPVNTDYGSGYSTVGSLFNAGGSALKSYGGSSSV